MTENEKVNEETQNAEGSEASDEKETPWADVINDFQSLGQNIANAINSSLREERSKERLKEVQEGLESIGNQISKSLDEALQTPQVDNVKTEMKKAVHEVKEVGNKAYTESKPFLVGALESLNSGIQKVIDSLQEHNKAPENSGAAEAQPSPAESDPEA